MGLRSLLCIASVIATTAAQNSTIDATTAQNSTIDATTAVPTTELHKCILLEPCAEHSECVEVGDDHVCRCKDGYFGVDSEDGEGCYRNSLQVTSKGKERGMMMSMGEGLDFHVKAGGEKRGRKASILAMAAKLDKVISDTKANEDLLNEKASEFTADLEQFNDQVTSDFQTLQQTLQQVVDTKIKELGDKVVANEEKIRATGRDLQQSIRSTADGIQRDIASERSRSDSKLASVQATLTKRVQSVESKLANDIGSQIPTPRTCNEVAEASGMLAAVSHLPKSKETHTFRTTIYPNGQLSSARTVNCKLYLYSEGPLKKLSLSGSRAKQSSTCCSGHASRAVDGNKNGNWGSGSTTHTYNDAQTYWRVDLGKEYAVHEVRTWGRVDCCWSRSSSGRVRVGNTDRYGAGTHISRSGGSSWSSRTTSSPVICKVSNNGSVDGRYVYVELTSRTYLQIAEVEVYAREITYKPYAELA